MPRPKSSKPSYRLHKPSGQAIVTLSGKTHYLGSFGSQESKDKYDRMVGEWIGTGRPTAPRAPDDATKGVTVSQVVAAFWGYAQQRYSRADGTTRLELDNYRLALRPLRRLYGPTPAREFTPSKLEALRNDCIRQRSTIDPDTKETVEVPGWCRNYCNRQMSRLKAVFAWAARGDMIPSSVSEKLRTVPGLQPGEFGVRESDPVQPVPVAYVDAAKKYLSRTITAMIDLQLLTGARPGEICAMRGVDIDMSGEVWIYSPPAHKTGHHGITRIVRIGERGKAILKPFLKADLTAFIFSPADAERERIEARTKARKTPLSCGNRPGSNVVKQRQRVPGNRYTVHGYRTAIKRACERADRQAHIDNPTIAADEIIVPEWAPGQLRHNAGTDFRRQFGIEVSQTLLGHKIGSRMTEIYSEADNEGATEIMRRIG